MTDERQKLAQMRQRLGVFRREHAPATPPPDPNNPGNPYHLPYANMDPSRMPTAADAAKAGAGFLQADMTAMIPMAIFHNLPGRLMNDFYDLTWDIKHGRGNIHGFVAKLEDDEIGFILKDIDSFPLDQLTATGATFYEAIMEEWERRKPPAKRVRIEATVIDECEHERHEEHEQQADAQTHLPGRAFPGPLLKPRM